LGNPLPWEQDNSNTLDSRLIEKIFGGSTALVRFANRRKFFSSKEAYIGLVPPGAEVGDVVIVFCGATIPFVVHWKRRMGFIISLAIGESLLLPLRMRIES
jgi:hypothetical protein